MKTVGELVPTATTLTLIGHNGQEIEDTTLDALQDLPAEVINVMPNAHPVIPGLSLVILSVQSESGGWFLYRTDVPDSDAP